MNRVFLLIKNRVIVNFKLIIIYFIFVMNIRYSKESDNTTYEQNVVWNTIMPECNFLQSIGFHFK